MSKMFYFGVILIGIMIILNAAGVPLPSGGIADSLGLTDLQNIEVSALYGLILTAFALAAGVGIAVGFITRTPPVAYLVAPVLILFTGLAIVDMVALHQILSNYEIEWVSWVATAIFAVLIGGFLITVLEWWKGGGD